MIKKAELTEQKEKVISLTEKNKDFIHIIGSTIWKYAELSRYEYKSSAFLSKTLEELGFKVERGIAGYPTSFIAKYKSGAGGPVIGLLAEYDALPEIGHGCGHNLFAAGALGAAIVMRDFIIDEKIDATVIVFGTPSEEEHGSKPYMAKQGFFDDVDCFMGFHPLEFNGVLYSRHNGIILKNYKFYGKSSHAGAEPHLGISALDAVEIMNVTVNYLREHVTSDVRIHYVISNGGLRPNIVPDFASSKYAIRAQEYDNLLSVNQRIDTIAKGIAMAIGCKVEIEEEDMYANTVLNRPYAELAYSNLLMIGAPKFSDEEQAAVRNLGLNKGLIEEIEPLKDYEGVYTASTDEGDVSWIGPWVRISTTCLADETPGHNTLVTEQANMPSGYKGIIQMVKVCTCTLVDVITNKNNLSAMKNYHKYKLNGKAYNRDFRKFPDLNIFPNMPGLEVKTKSLIDIIPDDTMILPEPIGKKIYIYLKDNIIGSCIIKSTNQPNHIKLNLELSSGMLLTIKYENNNMEYLLGYFKID